MNQSKNILYFYNGIETVGEDTEEDIKYWLYENGLDEDKFEDIKFIDKGYAFFRDWMDEDVEVKTIMKTIRYMVTNRIWTTFEIPKDIFEKLTDGQIEQDQFIMRIPETISLSELKKYNNAFLVGGGCEECLGEIKILLDSFNIKYTLMSKFIYG